MTMHRVFAAGLEEREVDAGGNDRVRAGEPLGGASRDVCVGGDEAVDPREQPVALRAAGWKAETLGIDERRCGGRLRLEQCRVREAGNSRVETVHDVERALTKRRRDARADADRHADRGPR